VRTPSPLSTSAARESRDTRSGSQGSDVPIPRGRGDNIAGAAQGPVPEPESAAENPAPAPPTDTAAEARGRRTLSTAFVMLGPGGHLTVELSGGRAIILRDVVMRRKDYCGTEVLGRAEGAHFCGRYDEVVAARPGGAPA